MLEVLYVEDQDADAALVKAILGNLVVLHWVRDLPQADSSIQYDLILLDLRLPSSSGMETVNLAVEMFPGVPIVILSQTTDDLPESIIVSGVFSVHDKASLDPMEFVRSIKNAADRTESSAAPDQVTVHRHLADVYAKIDRLIDRIQKSADESNSSLPTRNQ